MILNHKAAIEFLVENAEDIAFNRYTVLGLHALLSENLLPDPDDEGRLRTRAITIGTSVYTPTVIPQVIEQQFDTILTTAAAIPDPLEQSFFMMVHLPYLQPFIDVNKRTSRLAANIPLIRANLCPLSFVDVPEQTYTDGTLTIYEQKDVALLRDVFVWAYERSCAQFKVLRQAMGEPDPIRLNYRTQLRALIAEIVKDHAWPSDEALQERAALHRIPDADRSAFLTAARNDLRRLRPEILARYQLRQSEFDAWLAVVREARQRELTIFVSLR
ncbi:MAG: Fic family protein [Polaromonas sp.]|nr:Fic family protein [Gemmatimonadaceae bacterium]